nr:MAG TPA: hypothetical protein [Caudoviricetes sp.]
MGLRYIYIIQYKTPFLFINFCIKNSPAEAGLSNMIISK